MAEVAVMKSSWFASVVLTNLSGVNWCHPPLKHHSLLGPEGKEEGRKIITSSYLRGCFKCLNSELND